MTFMPLYRCLLLLAAVAGGCVSVTGCDNSSGQSVATPRQTSAASGASFAAPTRQPVGSYNGSDAEYPILPDPSKTPGDALAVTSSDVCQPGYAHAVRDVPSDVKRQVYQSYGIYHHSRGQFEVDHLISLELGGSNSVKNLWPESYQTQPWNARVKDQLEDKLHDDVCSRQMDLAAAQREIAGNWIDAYKQEFHTQLPLTTTQYGKRTRGRRHRGDEYVRATDEAPDNSGEGADSSAAPVVAYPSAAAASPVPITGMGAEAPESQINSPAAGAGEVWVNTHSHKYFYPNSRYYGHTKRGEYMTESQAQAAGNTPAKSE